MNETAARNDLFRKTVPLALVLFPCDDDLRNRVFGVSDQIINEVATLEFPEDNESDRDRSRGRLKVEGEVSGIVEWEIRLKQEGEENALGDRENIRMSCSTDLFGSRQRAGAPFYLEELKPMYDSHTLIIYMPGSKKDN